MSSYTLSPSPLVAAPDVVVSVDRLAVRGQRLVELLLDEVHVLQVVLLPQHRKPVFRVPPVSDTVVLSGGCKQGSYLLPSVQLFAHIAPLVEVGEALGYGQEPKHARVRAYPSTLCHKPFPKQSLPRLCGLATERMLLSRHCVVWRGVDRPEE